MPGDTAPTDTAPTDTAVHVASETGPLEVVLMRRAVPRRVDATTVRSFATSSGVQQLLRNRMRSFDHRRVVEQQEALADVLRAHGTRVVWAEAAPGCLSQHYTRDVGFVVDDVFVVARMGKPYRRGELAGLGPLLRGLPRVEYLDAGTIEGGDVMLHDGVVVVGLGDETSPAGVEALRRRLHAVGSDRRVVQLELTHRGVIHLDTKLVIVDRGVAVVEPRSFTPASLRWLESRFDLVVATPQEARDVQVNVLAIGGGRVVVGRTSERLAAVLESKGLTPVPVDYSEVTRVPGAFRCTTLPLVRGTEPGGQRLP